MLLAFRILSMMAWLATFIVNIPSIVSILRSEAKRLDYIWAVVCGCSFMCICFGGRWLIAPQSETLFAILYSISVLVAVAFVGVRFSHGRE